MSLEQNRQAARRIAEEIIDQGKVNLIDELVAPNYEDHNPGPGGPRLFGEGREGLRSFVVALREAFPDLCYEVIDLIAEGDKVVAFIEASGTFIKPFAGMAPTGKHAVWNEIHIGRFENGRFREHWGVEDNLGMLQQLGAVPAPRPA